jgi:hypothetical protein
MMTTAPTPMPKLPRPDQKVRWRNPAYARKCGWEALFGPGPFKVVRIVDYRKYGLVRNLVLLTRMGKREVPEVWLAVADDPDGRPASG